MSDSAILSQKREVILHILRDLSDTWELADGLYVLLSTVEDPQKLIESLEQILIEASRLASDIHTKTKMNEWISALQKMREKELLERENEKNSLTTLFL